MKNISLFLLLLIGTFAYAQSGNMTIYNFSTQSVTYRLVGTNDNSQPIDCQPILEGYPAVSLAPASTVTYTQYNTSHLVAPPINQWNVISDAIGIPGQTYNVSAGVTIPSVITSPTSWQSLDLNFANGEYMQLGRDCGYVNSHHGAFNGSTPSGITATWNYLGNNVVVFIN
ncbi:hypothetical protein [Chryseobacterium kwangjuense]|uniref:Uncharacterized protein n=1 Tax=Chryseobacterium kwangjuense TaxID=267125 RepID=A0A135WKF1_9FLAO|nr:hypothetical protein [Chryseobacterium kwangjuense]KXH85371.1 hypothetical protein AU378_06380 [Chryseobacterium kwangjuense]